MSRLIGYGFLAVLFLMLPTACTRQPSYPPPAIEGTNAVIDPASLKNEIPQFFTYVHRNKSISFFVIKLNDTVQSYFDACASCYPHRLGYRYEDGVVVCRACGMRFSVYQLEKGIGGCYPIKLEGRIENNRYLIPLSFLEAEAGKF